MAITLGAFLSFLSILLGAFGAHALEKTLDEKSLSWWHTATQYFTIHALALILLGLWLERDTKRCGKIPFYAFLIGIFLFSGSLYAMALTGITKLGIITPFGGLAFMMGWLSFSYRAYRMRVKHGQN